MDQNKISSSVPRGFDVAFKSSIGFNMQIGDLVKNVHTEEIGLITELVDGDYAEVNNRWLVPAEHLEVISESR